MNARTWLNAAPFRVALPLRPSGPPRPYTSPPRAAGARSRVVLGVCIQQPPDHPLVLCVVSARLVLEELDAALAQCDRDLDAFFAEDQVLRARKEIRDDLRPSETLIR